MLSTRVLLIAGLMVVFGVSSSGQPKGHTFRYWGAGGSLCGSWTGQRRGDDWFDSGQWVLGFVSATDRLTKGGLKRTDSDGLLGWIDNYCAEHPIERLAEAAQSLVVELAAN